MKMTFKEYLTELFQEKKSFKITTANNTYFEASFKVDGKKWLLGAGLDRSDSWWDVAFEDRDGNFEPTGAAKEGAIEVYAHIISILKYFIERYKPNMLRFEGFEPKQHQFYQRLIKRNKKVLDKLGYEIDSDKNSITIYKEE